MGLARARSAASLRAASAGPGVRLSCPIGADAADGADGIFERRAHRNEPGSGAAFTAEDNVDAQCPKEGLRAAQAAGKRTRASCPSYAPRYVIASTLGTQPQKACRAPSPLSPVDHDCSHAGGYGIRFVDTFDSGPAVRRVGASESAGRPECRFARCGPDREVSHARQPVELNAIQDAQPVRHRVEQGAEGAGARVFKLPPQLALSTSLRLSNGCQGQKNRAVSQIRPTDNVLDAVQEDRARRLK